MAERTIIIELQTGLHARPAAQLASFVKNYPGEVKGLYGEKSADMKSVLNIMAMAVKKGGELTLQVTGENEEAYADELVAYIQTLTD